MTNVLIAEDNGPFLKSLAFELEMQGYTVTQAANGEAALELLLEGQERPDIILSDISMPEMDGFGLLERVRSEDQWREIPFLFLTAHNSVKSMRTSRKLGVDDYLVKPFEIEDLLAAIENKLRRVDSLRQDAERRFDDSRLRLMEIMSHELNTPLQSIVGGTELLNDNFAATPDESIQEMLGYVQVGTERLRRVMRNILLLVDLTDRDITDELAPATDQYDFNEIVREAYHVVSSDPEYQERNIEVTEELSPSSVLVQGYREALLAMVMEPLRNAYEFSPVGGKVTLRTEKVHDIVRLTISDNGPGIDTDKLELVWKPFVQVDRKQREQQGMGIGLPLTRVCTLSHGGDCRIDVTEEGGTRFTLELPIFEINAADNASRNSVSMPIGPSAALSSSRTVSSSFASQM